MIDQLEIKKLEQLFSVKIVLSKITGGRRWSYTGTVPYDLPVGETKRILIDSGFGVIVYNWHKLNDLQKTSIEEAILNLK